MADIKPRAFEYEFGGHCLTSGNQTSDSMVEAVLGLIDGSRALYIPQGKMTIRFENPPESGDSGSGG